MISAITPPPRSVIKEVRVHRAGPRWDVGADLFASRKPLSKGSSPLLSSIPGPVYEQTLRHGLATVRIGPLSPGDEMVRRWHGGVDGALFSAFPDQYEPVFGCRATGPSAVRPLQPVNPRSCGGRVIADWKRHPQVGIRSCDTERARAEDPASTASFAPRGGTTCRSTCCPGQRGRGHGVIRRHPDTLSISTIWPWCSPARPRPAAALGPPAQVWTRHRPNAVLRSSARLRCPSNCILPDIGIRCPRVRRLGGDRACWARLDPPFAVVN